MKNIKKKILIIVFIACLLIIGSYFVINKHASMIFKWKNIQSQALSMKKFEENNQDLGAETYQSEELKPLSEEELKNPIKVSAMPTTYSAQTKQTGKLTYLSDIPFMSKSTTRYGKILNDITQANTKITVKIGGAATSFDKGIWAHATSDVYYDLRNFKDYDYFSAFLGINTTSRSGNGVTFIIYTSNDGTNWTEKFKTQALPNQNAVECRIAIGGDRYLRLYAHDNGANGSDHSVYADAKLLTADYNDGTGVPTIYDLDAQIKNMDENDANLEFALLKREFVSRVGRTTLINYINEGEANKETLNWLIGDLDTLGLYFYGSTPIGGYKNSLNVLTRLYQTYKNDLNDTTVKNGIQNGYLFKKMIMALSHTHSTLVRSFLPSVGEDGYDLSSRTDPNNPQVSDPVRRYAVYKKMYLANKLSFAFPKLEVEEMKGVMKALISDNEIEWLRDYIASRGGYSANSSITYKFHYQFFNDKYYSEENKTFWNNRYHFLEYGIPYQKYLVPQWHVFAEGNLCVGISQTSANVYNSMGIPAHAVGQSNPAHEAYVIANYDINGNGSWQLCNSGTTWGNTRYQTTAEDMGSKRDGLRQNLYTIRAILDWGQQYSTGCQNLSYMTIAQEAVNNLEAYKKAEQNVMLANVYKGDIEKQEELYRKAIKEQNINIDAWYGLVQLYKNNNTYTEEDCLRLIKEFQPIFRTRILAFYDFTNMLIDKIKTPTLNAETVALRTNTLQWAEINANSIHRGVAKTLLDKPKSELATFSFDGKYAGQIRLGDMYNEDNKAIWEYSIDGGKTWTQSEELYVQLTPTEILGINENNNILVHIIGTEIRATIQIDKNLAIGNKDAYANDAEDAIYIYQNKKMEWRYSDDPSGESAWKSYDKVKPNLSGNRSILLRFSATGTSLPEDIKLEFKFTDNKYPANETYIKTKNLSVVDSTTSGTNTPAKNMVDGNFGYWDNMLYRREYSRWLSANNTDKNKFITIELKEPVYLSRLDYLPSDEQDNSVSQKKPFHGRIMQGEVLGSMDGKNWTKLGDITNWANNISTKTIKFDNPQKVKYVKVVATQTNDGYIGGKGFNLYEDTTKEAPPTAEVKYSTTQKTNKNVVATLENFSSNTVVVDGASSYTFTENGAYTFNLRDTATGRTNEIVASVEWIDRVAPTAGIQYIELPNTKGYVQARIVNISKNVFILDEQGRPIRLIEKEGNYTYEYNFEPETKQLINMVQKDANNNIKWVRGYKLRDPSKPVSDIFENPNKNMELTGFPKENPLGAPEDKEYMIYYFAGYTNGKITNQIVYDENLKNDTKNYTAEQIEELKTKYTTGVQDDVLKYIFTKNGEKTYKIRDRIGNEAEVKMVVDWINRGPYIAEITYDKEGPTNENVTATLTFKEEGVKITNLNEGVIEIENGGKYVFTENGDFRFKLIDSENVESYLDAKVTTIDKQVPQGIITYSTTSQTNGNVTASIEFDKANVTITNNEGSNAYTFTDNGNFTFEFVDQAGNVGTATAEVGCIDRVAPTAQISYSTTSPTNGDVVANIVESSEDITIINNDGESVYTFTENGGFTFEFVDQAGNTGTATAKVTCIDKKEIVPTISYRINGPTGKAETSIITFNKKNVTVTNNSGKITHRFEENGSFEYEFRDEAGNTGKATATVDWIDKKIPTAEIHYDRTIGTKEPVTATLINPSKEIKITNNEGKNTYTFTKNEKFIFEFEDIAGNPGETLAEVTWIDKEAPTATITYSTTGDTTEPVIATLHLEDPNMGLMPTTQTYMFTKNGEHTFNFEDGLGNKGTATATVNWIYSGNLTADIKYEKTENGILATLVNENRPITLKNNNGNRTYLLTETNNTFTFEYEDNFGNEGRTEAKYENMNGPATINYVFKTLWAMVNNKRTLVPKWTANLVLPTGYEMKKYNAPKSYTFSEKGSYIFEYKDSATNEEYKATATADWFPEATLEFSTTELTKEGVDLIVHFNKEGEELEIGNDQTVNLSETYPHPLPYYMKKKEGTINAYTFMHNVEFTLLLTYQGQRLVSVPVSIKNIDETPPVGTIKYSNTEPTYRNVTATIEFNKKNVKILNNDGKDTFRFEQNGEFKFKYEDEVGHIGETEAKVDWIIEDSDDVVPTIVYSEKEPTNKNVVATITFDQDEVKIVDEQGNELPNGDVHTFTENGTHVFNYVDKKGKKGTATAEVLNIDKEVPIATINYSTTKKTNKPVTASISFNEENVTVEGGITHTFDDSGTYTFNFIDQAGNRGEAVAEVNWIRKTLPNATITYDETELTCKDVTATISFDLEGVVILDEEGEILPNGEKYIFTENGTHIFRFRGPYGNEGSAVARVNYIDKVLPVPTITYDVENQTSGNVTATITFDKRNVVVEGGNTHVFKTNGEHTFNFMDEAGNKGWATAKVTWIDSDLPIATITYDPKRPQGTAKVNTDVVAKITFDQENVKIINNGGESTYTFEQNGEHEFIYEDSKGQRGTALATVSWIDKEVPKPTITYNTTEPTNKDVTAVVTFDKENVKITNNGGKNTYKFTENNEFEFEFVGPSGNKGKVTAKVTWIDKTAPEATINYSKETSTNEDVTATITFNEDVTITNNEGKNTYKFTENGEFTFEYKDRAGNTGTKTAKVSWIDKNDLTATITYNINELTNKDVIATISFNKKNVTVKDGNTHTFTQNGEHIFEYTDEAGNTGTKLAKVTWIDKKVPVGTIKYSTTNPTNQNVTATITFDKENVIITNNDGNNTYTFTDIGEFTFEFIDKAGNTGTARAVVDWIDRKLPVATIRYDINTLTNHDVTATITFDKQNVYVEGGNTHTFTENGEYEFAFIGPAGNIGTAIAKVTWIDKKAPVATITYSTTNPTSDDVTATITFDKQNVIVEGGNTHTFTQNDEFTFRYIDQAGNTGTKLAKVTWIDKTLPKATINYSTTNITNGNVTATIFFDQQQTTITNNNGSNTYTFTKNGKFEFEFTGNNGNRGTAVAEVNWIDKDVPIPTISYDITTPTNKNVTASITFNEENVTVKGGNTHVFEDSGEYIFEFEDAAGNKGTAKATVDWIKKTLPNAKFTYDINTLTNQDVTVKVEFDRPGTRITNNDGKDTYTFLENGSFEFEFVGPYGNAGVATATVDWIDKDVPVPTIYYSTTEMTNQDVTATITFNEENVTVKGGNTHIFEDSGEYIFEFEDKAGNKGTATAKVDWLKKTLPNATITYSTTNPTNQDVIATIAFDRENVIVLGGNTHRFTENGEYVFEFVGPYGNKGTATAEVYWIDKVEPVATIYYSTLNKTNQAVTATVTFDKENVRITNNNGKNTYTFTENGEFEFEYVGPAGNTGIAMATVDWIDKTLPIGAITYNKTDPTNQDVTATITFDKEGTRITNNDGKNTYTFTENNEFEFEFVGPAGNAGTAIAKVTWIDKVPPAADIQYSTKNATNQPVIATIVFNEKDVTVEGGNTHTFTENGEYIFKYSDKAGNQGAKLAKVDWIDKTLPESTITYNTTDPTNQDVTATITFDKENVTVEGGNTHTFTENGEYEFSFVGPAGNRGVAIARVNWIDKIAPTAKVTYNIMTKTEENVVATLQDASEEITITNNDGNSEYTFTQNGTFTFEFIDKVGNRGTARAEVSWIKTDEEKYQEVKAKAIEKIEDYQYRVAIDEIENKKINAQEKSEVISAYDSLRDEDKSAYTEFINRIKAGGKPVITKPSIELIKYKVGEKVDLYSLITIKDNEDENIVSNEENVKVTTNLNIQEAGIYNVTYEVADSDGNKTILTIQVIIEDEEEDPNKFKITSSKYDIKNNMILNVSKMTTVDDFKSLITVNRTIHIMNKEGVEQDGEDIVATGMKITVDNEDEEYTVVVIGDLSGDGTRDIDDLARAKLHFIGIQLLENEYLQAFDVDKDGEITINDIAVLKMSLIDLMDLD